MLSRRSRAVSVTLACSSVSSSEAARARSAWLVIFATRFTSSSTRLLSGGEGGLTVEERHEAPGGHLSDRVPMRAGAAAGPGVRHQAATGRQERRAAVRRAVDR